MNFVFLMDPLSTVKVEKDTTLMLMLKSHQRGHSVFFLPEGGINRKNGKLYFAVTKVTPQFVRKRPFVEHESVTLCEDDVSMVFIRTDPPFDQEYLLNTWLLDLLPPSIPVMNRPSGIRTVNEKIWATQFTEIIPRTFVGSQRKGLLDFLTEEKDVVTKPTGSYGGQGILRLKKSDPESEKILEKMTEGWSKEIILQQFIPESDQGDKRILLLNGDPMGAVLRVHAEGQWINNFYAGGTPHPAEITQHDEEIIAVLKPHLQKLGLYFVGIDVIGNYLTEVNVTSPTCLQEINRLNNVQLEKQVIDFVEQLIGGC